MTSHDVISEVRKELVSLFDQIDADGKSFGTLIEAAKAMRDSWVEEDRGLNGAEREFLIAVEVALDGRVESALGYIPEGNLERLAAHWSPEQRATLEPILQSLGRDIGILDTQGDGDGC